MLKITISSGFNQFRTPKYAMFYKTPPHQLKNWTEQNVFRAENSVTNFIWFRQFRILVLFEKNLAKIAKLWYSTGQKEDFPTYFQVSRKSGSNYEKIGKSQFSMGQNPPPQIRLKIIFNALTFSRVTPLRGFLVSSDTILNNFWSCWLFLGFRI